MTRLVRSHYDWILRNQNYLRFPLIQVESSFVPGLSGAH